MDVFVGSLSKHKLPGAEGAIKEVFDDVETKVFAYNAKSSINEQPEGHEETIKGAFNRLKDLKRLVVESRGAVKDAIFIAIENGIFPVEVQGKERWFDLAWVVIEDTEGNQSISHSGGIEFDSDYVEEAKKRGFETTTVGSIISRNHFHSLVNQLQRCAAFS